MRKRLGFAAPTVAFFMLVISPVIGRAQTAPPANPGAADAGDQHVDGWGRLVLRSPEAGKTLSVPLPVMTYLEPGSRPQDGGTEFRRAELITIR